MKKAAAINGSQGAIGFWYFLGMIGSAVYFVQQAEGFWPVIGALLQALVWPAFMVYDVFIFITR